MPSGMQVDFDVNEKTAQLLEDKANELRALAEEMVGVSDLAKQESIPPDSGLAKGQIPPVAKGTIEAMTEALENAKIRIYTLASELEASAQYIRNTGAQLQDADKSASSDITTWGN